MKEEKKLINKKLIENPSLVVNFSKNLDNRYFELDHFYILYYNDELFEDTSIIRVKADSLHCREVY